MTRNTIVGIGIAVAILILIIIWLLVGRQASYTTQISPTPVTTVTPQATATGTATPAATQTATPAASTVQVIITSTGFSPTNVEIPKGGTVTWINNDTASHQVASTPHPVHTDYPPLNSVGTLQPGQSRSLKFDKAGTYRYHDHLNPGSTGNVVVKGS